MIVLSVTDEPAQVQFAIRQKRITDIAAGVGHE